LGMQPLAAVEEFVLVTPPYPTKEEFDSTINNRKVDFNISKYVREGWMFTKYNLWQFFAIGFLIALVSIGINVAFVFAVHGRQWWYEGGDGYPTTQNILITVSFAIGRTLLFGFPVLASMYKAVFNAMRNNTQIRFCDFFSCFTCPYWCKSMGLALVLTLISISPYFFWPLIFPSFYVCVTSIFAIPMHVEHSFIGVFNSLCFSFKIFHSYFCSMLAFLLLLGVLQILGFACFVVGLFVTIPVAFASVCYCYHHLVGVNGVAVLVPTGHLEGMPVVSVPVDAPTVAPVVPAVAPVVVPVVPVVASAPYAV